MHSGTFWNILEHSETFWNIYNMGFDLVITRNAHRWNCIELHFLSCTVLYCFVLFCTVLYCIVLYCTVLYCLVLSCTDSVCVHSLDWVIELRRTDRRTDGQTDIRTCWAASSQLKMSIHSMRFQVQNQKNLHCMDTIHGRPVSLCHKNI